MLHGTANRIRPTLEALEVREVYFAGVAMGLPYPAPVPALPAGPLTPVVQVCDFRVEPTKDPVARGPAAKPSPCLNQVDSVITLRNDTTTTIRLSVRWAGTTEVTRYTLAPGQVERVTFRQVEKVRPNLTAVIQYAPEGRGTARTVQVASGLAGVGPDGTSPGDGRVYTFRSTAGGIRLVAGPHTPPVMPGLPTPPSTHTTR
jgi:hypothetical protein